MKVINDSALSYIWTKLRNRFQDKLISGTNIKTINNTSILGSGNIDIQGGGDTYRINGTYDPTAQPEADYVIDGSVYPAEDVYDAVQDGMNLVLSLDGSIYTEYTVSYMSVGNNDPTQMIILFMKSVNHGYTSYTIQINLTTNPKSYGYCYSGGDRFAFGYSTSGNNRAVIQQENTNKLYVWAQAPLVSGTNIKTVNNQSLLGSGDITIGGGGGNEAYELEATINLSPNVLTASINSDLYPPSDVVSAFNSGKEIKLFHQVSGTNFTNTNYWTLLSIGESTELETGYDYLSMDFIYFNPGSSGTSSFPTEVFALSVVIRIMGNSCTYVHVSVRRHEIIG